MLITMPLRLRLFYAFAADAATFSIRICRHATADADAAAYYLLMIFRAA